MRAVVSTAPVVGGLLTEIITELIPNQRLDRVERFILALAEEVQRAGCERCLPTSEGPQLELVESGLRAASMTSSTSKIEHLAKCAARGLTKDEGDAIRAQRILKILSELDPEELIVLLYHTKLTIAAAQEFRKLHPAIFDLPLLMYGCDQDVRKRNAEYQAAERHLISLGLVSEEIKFDSKTGSAKLTIRKAEKDVQLTIVGRLVLHHAGLIEEV
ncbi:hypothetical protein SR870_17990 [Rhodopseudomonas palustris]|uniref:hypothetical protein n=1 Tax=Rhodopseudomonas palustris TaxID=1076 RepID=UPI002ACE4EC3|nr:hypothetical protein [Rhodopseudomonas palustris]WQG98571.1 hypothetical protein SR870_17990 [Rhodopseudomonas palustris]